MCVKEHEIRHGQQQRFTKFCANADACTDHHCKEEGRKCTVDCCHQDLCNEASTIATSRTTLVFFALLVNVISKFCLFWIRYLLNVISRLCNSLDETCSSRCWVLEELNLRSGNPDSFWPWVTLIKSSSNWTTRYATLGLSSSICNRRIFADVSVYILPFLHNLCNL